MMIAKGKEDGAMARFGLKDEVVDFIANAAYTTEMGTVILFGSRATGCYSDKSDIDLAVLGPRLHDFEEALEERCPTLLTFDIIDLSKDISEELKRRIDKEGVKLYG